MWPFLSSHAAHPLRARVPLDTLHGERWELTADSRPLVKVRNTHHLAARSLAEGKKDVEVSLITGYTPARIGQLKDDPSFQELLAYYKSQVESKWLSVQERLASIGLAVSEEMMSRFEEDPSRFSNEELRRWFETTMDRSGNGPSATRNVNIQSKNASLLLIEKIKRETEDSSQVRQIAAE
jgi:hypothetical protein